MRKSISLLFMLAAIPAWAHPGHGSQAIGFFTGFGHPFTGLDHLLAMLAVGLWSATTTRRIWLAPSSFIGMMLIGAWLAINGVVLPAIEPMIAASVFVLGLMVSARVRVPDIVSAFLVSGFALFHGAAHGVALGNTAALSGMVIATALLHSIGIVAGLRIKSSDRFWLRGIGVGIALTGAGLALNLI